MKKEKESPQLAFAKAARDKKYKKMNPGSVYAWPMGFWFSLFFVIPLIIIVAYSFMKRDVYGSVIA